MRTSSRSKRTNGKSSWGLHLIVLPTLAALHFSLAGCAGLVSGTRSSGGGTPPPDTTPPTVSVTSPAAGSVLSGSVNLTATASDNVAVASVQFKVDNANVGAALAAAPFSFTLDSTTLSNGNHVIAAVATDTSGNTATSANVSVKVDNTVSDTTPPTVSITSPANAATVSGTVAVQATASDNVSVASVQFQLDGVNVGSADIAPPYAYSWDTTKTSNGSHALTAIAKDGAGNTAKSSTVSGTVSVTATASDNVGVASVQFQLDGANVGTVDTATPYSYSWDTTKSANGAHSLTAIAKDAAGNSTTSSAVSVTVKNSGTSDTTPPSVPTGLTASAASSSQINLTWNASTDNVGVAGYNVYRNGNKVASATGTFFQDAGLAASTTYSYTVAAFDAAGNTSAQSAAASATTSAPSSGGGGIPSALGWFQIPNTAFQSACPPASAFPAIQGQSGCNGVVNAWSGGVADTKRNRLIFWGGGHHDYWGNEVYALDLNALTLSRLNNPSSVSGLDFTNNTYETLPDGTPSARHTYGGLAYIPLPTSCT